MPRESAVVLSIVRGEQSSPTLYCRRPGCERTMPEAGLGRPAVFCSSECRRDFHVAAKRARRGVEEATAVLAQYQPAAATEPDCGRRDQGVAGSAQELALEILGLAGELRAESVDQTRERIIAVCSQAIRSAQ